MFTRNLHPDLLGQFQLMPVVATQLSTATSFTQKMFQFEQSIIIWSPSLWLKRCHMISTFNVYIKSFVVGINITILFPILYPEKHANYSTSYQQNCDLSPDSQASNLCFSQSTLLGNSTTSVLLPSAELGQ